MNNFETYSMLNHIARPDKLRYPSTGFNFVNCKRNTEVIGHGYKPPQAFTSGTTIVGVIYRDGVIIGADTRSMNDRMIGSRTSKKIRRLHDHIYCGGAGMGADLDKLADVTEAQLGLMHMNSRRMVPIQCANKLVKFALFRFSSNLTANFVIGGVDKNGPGLYCTRFDGSSERVPYTSLGSGHFAAMAMLETRYRIGMSEGDAIDLVSEAVLGGIVNDLASGSSIDLCIIRCDGSVEMSNEKLRDSSRAIQYPVSIKPGTTQIHNNLVHRIEVISQTVHEVPTDGKPAAPQKPTRTRQPRARRAPRKAKRRGNKRDDDPPSKRRRQH